MPLSDEEQKILREIEAQLNATDPGLVEQVSRTTLYRHSARSIKWAVLAFVFGLGLMVFTFTASLATAFAGFCIMLGALFVVERNLRRMGKGALNSLTGRDHAEGGVRNPFGEGSAWRERFRRRDDR